MSRDLAASLSFSSFLMVSGDCLLVAVFFELHFLLLLLSISTIKYLDIHLILRLCLCKFNFPCRHIWQSYGSETREP
jgi:hypothetical protein